MQMIYVEGLPEGVSIDEVAEHFGSIGVVKFDKKKNQKKVTCFFLDHLCEACRPAVINKLRTSSYRTS